MSYENLENAEGVASEISLDQVFVHVSIMENLKQICHLGILADMAVGAERVWFVKFDDAQAALSHVYDKNGARHEYFAALIVFPQGTRIKELRPGGIDLPYFYTDEDVQPDQFAMFELGQYVLPNVDAREILKTWMINLTHVGFARALWGMAHSAIEIFGALHTRLLAEYLEDKIKAGKEMLREKILEKDPNFFDEQPGGGYLGEDLEHHDHMVAIENESPVDPRHAESCRICKEINDRAEALGLYEPSNIIEVPADQPDGHGEIMMPDADLGGGGVTIEFGDHSVYAGNDEISFDRNGMMIELQHQVISYQAGLGDLVGLVVGFEDGKPVVEWPGLGKAVEYVPHWLEVQ